MKNENYLTCIQDFKLKNELLFESGKKYKTYDLYEREIFIYYNEQADIPIKRGYTFYFPERMDNAFKHLITDYFLVEQEIRKEKLKNLQKKWHLK